MTDKNNRASVGTENETYHLGVFEWARWKTISTVLLSSFILLFSIIQYLGLIKPIQILTGQIIMIMILAGVLLAETDTGKDN